ncbi:hypothetical protein F4808DRAFT_174473 [Astrocystis sublimbata]|nr:hypothetical protein F4808DRAFT_174473 [Astrocystis sublimbata]
MAEPKGGRDDPIQIDDSPPPKAPPHPAETCKNAVLSMLPDVCPTYLQAIVDVYDNDPDNVVTAILDLQQESGSYPTRAPLSPNPLKRKRGERSNDIGQYGIDDENKYFEQDCVDNEHDSLQQYLGIVKDKLSRPGFRESISSAEYNVMARQLLSQDFPRVPMTSIQTEFQVGKTTFEKSLFAVYLGMDEKLRNQESVPRPLLQKRTATKRIPEFAPDRLPSIDINKYKIPEQAAIKEMIAVRKYCSWKNNSITAEKHNFLQAQKNGQTLECGICCEEYALNRMVKCDGETAHWFCRKCLKTHAESLVGMAKYDITCMSMDGCPARFSQSQRALFVDKKLAGALDRIEQEAVLRMANIENLATCPFCPYAAEYPPVEINKEFLCENPRCLKVSCRLCHKESHIPRSCAEVEADRGLNARHTVEEAMTEALVRRCNNCKNPFVKLDGCNKIRCTKCGTMQCDVCRKTIKDYSHFNDPRRGGKPGQCPLFDESQGRYEKEVKEAQKKMAEEFPDMDEEVLGVSNAEKAIQDVHQHKAVDPHQRVYDHRARDPHRQHVHGRIAMDPQHQHLQVPARPLGHGHPWLRDGLKHYDLHGHAIRPAGDLHAMVPGPVRPSSNVPKAPGNVKPHEPPVNPRVSAVRYFNVAQVPPQQRMRSLREAVSRVTHQGRSDNANGQKLDQIARLGSDNLGNAGWMNLYPQPDPSVAGAHVKAIQRPPLPQIPQVSNVPILPHRAQEIAAAKKFKQLQMSMHYFNQLKGISPRVPRGIKDAEKQMPEAPHLPHRAQESEDAKNLKQLERGIACLNHLTGLPARIVAGSIPNMGVPQPVLRDMPSNPITDDAGDDGEDEDGPASAARFEAAPSPQFFDFEAYYDNDVL